MNETLEQQAARRVTKIEGEKKNCEIIFVAVHLAGKLNHILCQLYIFAIL